MQAKAIPQHQHDESVNEVVGHILGTILDTNQYTDEIQCYRYPKKRSVRQEGEERVIKMKQQNIFGNRVQMNNHQDGKNAGRNDMKTCPGTAEET